MNDDVASGDLERDLDDIRLTLKQNGKIPTKIASKTKKFQPAAKPIASSM
jgi:hypothetical protein